MTRSWSNWTDISCYNKSLLFHRNYSHDAASRSLCLDIYWTKDTRWRAHLANFEDYVRSWGWRPLILEYQGLQWYVSYSSEILHQFLDVKLSLKNFIYPWRLLGFCALSSRLSLNPKCNREQPYSEVLSRINWHIFVGDKLWESRWCWKTRCNVLGFSSLMDLPGFTRLLCYLEIYSTTARGVCM